MAKKTQKGWIKIHKQIKDSAVWSDPLRLKAWIDILISANYEDKEWFANGSVVQIKRGQFVTSNRKLQEAWGCSGKTVKKVLTQFTDLKMIKVEFPNKKYTLITVVKYGDFQDVGNAEGYTEGNTESHTEGYTEGNAEYTQLKNIKNIKNYKELKNTAAPEYDSLGRIVE
jgi:DNA replication protein DnaD